ncbi:zinc finger AN1 domain-containing stress-associated protein 15-like [Dendrobium catenatum]|uniref:Zinc finger AN1 domain-containing stress-associated protein 15 n=1 Tax=Dendrobium catenatum TaxID=906689 RepID=A0A2I0W5Y6_9ASPA|nr:zinc finger AN1 domain-containing stress-associated protein 15-like [Dendrobium catenatum]PKU71076.1 Zinc finger AN1 domain-containing stress-associated protein 15 [Dendrobium catenatum]
MARESCNLGNDEAEILTPSSPSPSSSTTPQNPSSPSAPPSQPVPQQQPSCLLLKPSQDFLGQRSERPEIVAAVVKVSSLIKSEEVSRQPALCGHRCSTCRRRLGLTGFRCRCGDLFCGRHRYSDTHDCSFDYKAAGREEISKANPVIRAAKIIKI